jgi:hypothetical protein
MAIVKVRNMNQHPFEQKHKNGQMIQLAPHGKPGDFVEMDEEDAVVFLGQFKPFKMDNKGNHDPRHYKMLKIERDPNEVKKDRESKIICPVCREQTSSYIELEAHQRLMHSDQLVRDSEYETYLEQKAKANAKSTGAGAPKGS